jgi:hypothetical protein
MASVTHLTNQSQFVQAGAVFNGTNATGTIASNGISVSVAPQTAFVFSNSNGVTFGTNGSTVTATVATNYQSQGAYLTTARASNDAIGLNSALTANGVSMTANSSGLSLNFPAFLTTAQPVGAYLTTARASNDAIGLNTAQSNVTWTVNSSGLSFDARGYAGTGFSGTNVSGTINSNGVQLSVLPAVGGGGYTAGMSNLGNTVGTTGVAASRLLFAGGNGVTLSQSLDALSSSGTITISVATNYQSQGAYLTTAGLSGDSSKYIQNWKLTGNTAGTTSSAQGTDLWLAGGNGVTISGSSNTLSFSVATNYQSQGAYLTTARASNDAVGLNTALTAGPLAWTVNSSGISLNAGSAAGTTSGFGGNLISGSMTHNTAGLNLSLNHPAWLTTAMASNRGSDFVQATAAFAGTNASGTIASNGISISVAAPGAAAENNWVNLLGANTAGNTTASGSTIGYSGINLTLSGTNNSVINISAPAVSSLVGVGGISISTNGSTISISGQPVSQRWQYPHGALSALSAFGNGSFSINRMDVPNNITATRVDMPILFSMGSSATANTAGFGMTAFAAIYTKNGSTLSSLSSGSQTIAFTVASNTAGSTQMLVGAIRPVSVPMNVLMTGGEYYVGYGISTNTVSSGTATTSNGVTISAMGGLGYSSAIGWVGDFTATTNTSTGMFGGMGVYSAAISTVPPAVSLSAINQTGSYYSRANIGVVFRNI